MWRRTALLLAALALGLVTGPAQAQAFPSRPIRLVVPFAAGGPSDVVARIVGQKLAEILGQPVLVENRAGAGGNIGSAFVAKAPADGYTLVSGTVATHAINASLYRNMPYDTAKDFVPVALTVASTLVLVAHPSLRVKSLEELVALAKAKPGELSFASPGVGSPHHLAEELLSTTAGIKMVHVPYSGAAPAINALLGGQVMVGMVGLPAALPYIKAGKLVALGITASQRDAIAPEVPTLAESGLPGYEVGNWQAVFAPAGTPKEVVSKLNAGIAKVLQDPEVKDRLNAQGYETLIATPDQAAAYSRQELEKWANVVKTSGATVE